MPSLFLKQLLNFEFTKNYVPAIKEGRFSLINQTHASATTQGSQYKADLELRTDFQFAGRNVRVEIQQNYTNYSGYNKKFIDETGTYDSGLALEEFSRTSAEKRIVKEETFALVAKHTEVDSHELFILNMVISWGKALLYKMHGDEDFELKFKTSPYKDSHVVIPLDQSFEDHTYTSDLGVPVDPAVIMGNGWELRSKEHYWDKKYVLHYNASGLGQEAFYLSHVFGRTTKSALHFEVDLPGIDTNELALDPVNGSGSLPSDFDSIPWDKPDTLWSWIIDYVRLNRLEQQFAAVLESFGAMAIQPQWSSAEGCMWQNSEIVLAIGAFSPTRAKIRSNLIGEPYNPYVTALEFLLKEATMPVCYLQTCAIVNYLSLYGLYTLIHNEARSRSDWRTAVNSVADELQILNTPNARAACISAITGQEYATCMTDGCGVYIDTTELCYFDTLRNYKRLDRDFPEQLPLNALFAPVSGSLILGSLNSEFEVTSHLTSIQHMQFQGSYGVIHDLRTMLQVSNMYRLFGHNVYFRDHLTQELVQPWATAHECIIEPSSIEFDPCKPRKLVIDSAVAREGRSHILPSIINLLDGNSATLSIQKPTIRVVAWQSRKTELRPFVQIAHKKTKAEFKIKSSYTSSPISYQSKPFKHEKMESGFQKAMTETTPAKPEGIVVKPRPEEESSSVGTEMTYSLAAGAGPSTAPSHQ